MVIIGVYKPTVLRSDGRQMSFHRTIQAPTVTVSVEPTLSQPYPDGGRKRGLPDLADSSALIE